MVEIVSTNSQSVSVIPHLTHSSITAKTYQTANTFSAGHLAWTALVVMVDTPSTISTWVGRTTPSSTFVILSRKSRVPPRLCDVVLAEDLAMTTFSLDLRTEIGKIICHPYRIISGSTFRMIASPLILVVPFAQSLSVDFDLVALRFSAWSLIDIGDIESYARIAMCFPSLVMLGTHKMGSTNTNESFALHVIFDYIAALVAKTSLVNIQMIDLNMKESA